MGGVFGRMCVDRAAQLDIFRLERLIVEHEVQIHGFLRAVLIVILLDFPLFYFQIVRQILFRFLLQHLRDVRDCLFIASNGSRAECARLLDHRGIGDRRARLHIHAVRRQHRAQRYLKRRNQTLVGLHGHIGLLRVALHIVLIFLHGQAQLGQCL